MKNKKIIDISDNRTLLSKFSYLYAKINRLMNHFKKAALSAFAGQAAFFMILSFFPFFMFLLSLFRYTPFTESMLLKTASALVPEYFRNYISSIINEIYNVQTGAVLSATIIVAIWLGSKAFLSLIQGLNSVYNLDETRNYIIIRIYSFFYTVVFAILIVVILTVIVFGNKLYYYIRQHFPFTEKPLASIINVRAVISFLVLFLFFWLLYVILPNRKATFTHQIPGALVASAGWLIFSYIYSFYVNNINNYSKFYGPMTTMALLMLWLYACMYILFLGGMLNHLLEKKLPAKAKKADKQFKNIIKIISKT